MPSQSSNIHVSVNCWNTLVDDAEVDDDKEVEEVQEKTATTSVKKTKGESEKEKEAAEAAALEAALNEMTVNDPSKETVEAVVDQRFANKKVRW